MLKIKSAFFLLMLSVVFSACGVTYELAANNKMKFEDGIDVEVLKVKTSKGQSTWGGYSLVPPRKHEFIYLTLQISNTATAKKTVDLTKIVLLNAVNKTKYPVNKIYQVAPVPITASDDLKIDAGEQIKRVLLFTYPERLRPNLLEVNGEAHEVVYK